MSLNINLIKRSRRSTGASLSLVITLMFLLVIIGSGLFYIARLFGGQRETDNASDAGILNAANKANVSPAIASSTLPNQIGLPYSDFYPFASQTSNGSPAYSLDDFGRCVARAAIVELNRQIINSSAPNTIANAHANEEAQAVANIGTAMKTAIADASVLNSNYGSLANANNTNFISGQTDLSLLQNISSAYVNAGTPSNILAPQLDSNLLPNPASYNASVIPTVSSIGQNFVAGYTAINVGGVNLETAPLAQDTHLISQEIFSAGLSSPASSDPSVPPNAFQASAKQAIGSSNNSSENNSSSNSNNSNGPKEGSGSSSSGSLFAISSAQTGTTKVYQGYIPGYIDIYNPGTPGSMCSSPDAADPPNVLYNISVDAFNLSGFGVAGAGPVAFVTPPINTSAGSQSLLGGLGDLSMWQMFATTKGYTSSNQGQVEKINGSTYNKALDPVAIFSGFSDQSSNHALNSVVNNAVRIAAGTFPPAQLGDLLAMAALNNQPQQYYNIKDFFANYSSDEALLSTDTSTLNTDNQAVTAAQAAQQNALNAYNAALSAYNNAVSQLNTDTNTVNTLNAQISWNTGMVNKDAATANTLGQAIDANVLQHNSDNKALDQATAAGDQAAMKAAGAACQADQNQWNSLVAQGQANQANMQLAQSIVAQSQAALPGAQQAVTNDQSAITATQSALTSAQNALNAANTALAQAQSAAASQASTTNNAIGVSGQTAQEFLNFGTDGWQVYLGFITAGQQQQNWNTLVNTNAVTFLFDKNNGYSALTAAIPFTESDFDGTPDSLDIKYPWLDTIANNIQNLLPPATTTPSSQYIIDAVTSLKQKVNQARAQGKVQFTFNMPAMTDPFSGKNFVGLISGIAKYDRFAQGVSGNHVIHRVLNGGLNWGNGGNDKKSVTVAPSAPFSSYGTTYEIITQVFSTANGAYPNNSQAMGCNTNGDHSFNANDPRYQKMINLLAFMVQEISLQPHSTTDIVNALNSYQIPLGAHGFLQEVNGKLVVLPTFNGAVPTLTADSSWGANDSVTVQTGWYMVAGGKNPTSFKSCAQVASECANDALVDSTPGDGNALGDDGTHDNPSHCMGTQFGNNGASIQEQQSVRLGLCTGLGGKVGEMDFEDQLRVTKLNGSTVSESINFFHPN